MHPGFESGRWCSQPRVPNLQDQTAALPSVSVTGWGAPLALATAPRLCPMAGVSSKLLAISGLNSVEMLCCLEGPSYTRVPCPLAVTP